MAATRGGPPAGTGLLRERLVVAASALTAETGWAAVTMGKLADRVGVSRQTVYNEIGNKPALAEAMILQELDRFLTVVQTAFDQHEGELVDAIRAAARGVLELAQDNPLLHAVVSATHGADTELLPLLTTHAESLLAAAKIAISDRLASYELDIDARRLDGSVDAVVRIVLSHVMQPSGTPAETADNVAWIVGRVLQL